MAVRNDFSAGETLTAQDLNDTFASKPTFTYGTATPTADADGAIWYDENETPPVPKFWDGSAWQPFSTGAGDADFSNSATGTYTDTGVDYKYVTFTASGTLTVTQEGWADILVVGGGGGGANNGNQAGGGGGDVQYGSFFLSAQNYTVTRGASGSGADSSLAVGGTGGTSSISGVITAGGGAGGMTLAIGSGNYSRAGVGGGGSAGGVQINSGSNANGGGAGSGTAGKSISITGSSVAYAAGGTSSPSSTAGSGGWSTGSGQAGTVIVRVRTN